MIKHYTSQPNAAGLGKDIKSINDKLFYPGCTVIPASQYEEMRASKVFSHGDLLAVNLKTGDLTEYKSTKSVGNLDVYLYDRSKGGMRGLYT